MLSLNNRYSSSSHMLKLFCIFTFNFVFITNMMFTSNINKSIVNIVRHNFECTAMSVWQSSSQAVCCSLVDVSSELKWRLVTMSRCTIYTKFLQHVLIKLRTKHRVSTFSTSPWVVPSILVWILHFSLKIQSQTRP